MKIPLDVSQLEPCEPLELTLNAVRELDRGDYLEVLHRREPLLLFPMLEKFGMEWLCQEIKPERFRVLIWYADDPRPEGVSRDILC